MTTLGESIYQPLIAAEKAGDEAALHTTRLLAALFEAHVRLGYSAATGADLVDQAGALLTRQIAERRERVAFHQKVADFKAHSAFRTLAIGGSGIKSDEVWQPLTGSLSLVQDSEAA